MSKVAEIGNMIEELLLKREQDIEDLQELINTDIASVANAEQKIADATEAGDVVSYQKAKAEKRFALDSKEMHEKRLENIKSAELITKAEYESMVRSIEKEVKTFEDQTQEILAGLTDQMHEAAMVLKEKTEEGDRVLSMLHDKVYNAMRKNNQPFSIAPTLRTWETIRWGEKAHECEQYKDYLKK